MKNSRKETITKTEISKMEGMNENMNEFERLKNALKEEDEVIVMDFDISCGIDMKPLYELLLAQCGEDVPTLVVLNEFPREFLGLEYGFIKSLANPNKLILLLEKRDEDSMKRILTKAITTYQNQSTLKFILAYHPEVVMPLISNMAHAKSMYEHAIKITSLLRIPCPQIIMHEKEFLEEENDGFTMFYNDECGNEIGMSIHIRKDGRIAQLRTLAHELRHCWQNTYGNDKDFCIGINPVNTEEYFYNSTEVDAEAYSCLYVKEFKGYADAYSLLPDIVDFESHRYVHTVLKRMGQIQLAA